MAAQPQTDWPVRPSETPFCAAVGQVKQDAEVEFVEYLPAGHAVHTLLAVVLQLERLWPGTHVVHCEQTLAPAADHVEPATHAEHTWSAVGLQLADRKVPAAHGAVVQLAHGA